MSDLVLVALISAGFASLTAVLTHYLASKAANKAADRAERREAEQWKRSENQRQEELARKEAQDALEWNRSEVRRAKEAQLTHLRELWEAVTEARRRLWDHQVSGEKGMPRSDRSVTEAAARAHLVALVALPSLREVTTEFHGVAVGMEAKLQSKDREMHIERWAQAIEDLEQAIASLARQIQS